MITSHIHSLASSSQNACLIYVVSPDGDMIHAAAKVDPDINIVDDQVFQGNERRGFEEANAVATITSNFQSSDC